DLPPERADPGLAGRHPAHDRGRDHRPVAAGTTRLRRSAAQTQPPLRPAGVRDPAHQHRRPAGGGACSGAAPVRRPLPFSGMAALALLAGCTWVTQSPEALQSNVQALDTKDALVRCEKIAANELKVAYKLGSLQRMPDDVEHDLRTMAINQAATVG